MDGKEIKSKTRYFIIGQLEQEYGLKVSNDKSEKVENETLDIMNIKNKLRNKEVISPGKEKKTAEFKRKDLTGLLFDRLILNETFNKPGPAGRGSII